MWYRNKTNQYLYMEHKQNLIHIRDYLTKFGMM